MNAFLGKTKSLVCVAAVTAVFLLVTSPFVQAAEPDVGTMRQWIQEMKTSPRGPFNRIRWFCRDGTLQPPEPFACSERGGGVQHGEWSDRVKAIRDQGFIIANVLADVDGDRFVHQEQYEQYLKQILLEAFLIDADDGWIFRQARYYRGALQAEDEVASGKNILLALLAQPQWRTSQYLVMREAVRSLPHGRRGAPVSEMRQFSRLMAEKDPGFEKLRIKIHVKPDERDAQRVREYAKTKGNPQFSEDYERLAQIILRVYRTEAIGQEIAAMASQIPHGPLARSFMEHVSGMSEQNGPGRRLAAAGRLLEVLRENLDTVADPSLALSFMDASISLADQVFRYGNVLRERLAQATRRERLRWLESAMASLYGQGFLSGRQLVSARQCLTALQTAPPSPMTYKTELDYLSRVPGWADQGLRFHFSDTVRHLAKIEPLTRLYIHDRLRSSALLFYADVLDSLIRDAGSILGMGHELFSQPVAYGLKGLNPGLARGVLKMVQPGTQQGFSDHRGIYIVPAVTDDLPPVAGIVTSGEGNALSHVQLLSRNLGIPNAAVAKGLLGRLREKVGRPVVLAVSPRGVVLLDEDSPKWEALFQEEKDASDLRIRPDLGKLDLSTGRFISLDRLRASDSGRLAGPKAANLGELKHRFPEAVANGLVIPFGVFRALLDTPLEPGGPPVFQWMQSQYGMLRQLKDPQRRAGAAARFLETLREWIVRADPGPEFRAGLRRAMDRTFGLDGTYGVFVRSDTNVEDLPSFTGAGLNLTVPNVVGFDNILAAVSRVWASPFTKRAYAWRQAYMDQPEHVYASVLLMHSVPVEKSGVMVTTHLESGEQGWLSVAVNEGVGGAVSGQRAEELRVDRQSGSVRLLNQATEPLRRILLPEGGVGRVAASGNDAVLQDEEIRSLMAMAESLPERFPTVYDELGKPIPWDVEFGFTKGRLALFQIRPFLESAQARKSVFLRSLDTGLGGAEKQTVNLDDVPRAEKL
jgi:hypothetical protein